MALRFNWLMFTFAAQIVTFLTFLFAFFNMEQHRQSEISELQKELHKARAQQTRANRQLLACTRESATYRAREGADFNYGADWENEEGEETPDGTVDGTDDGTADGTADGTGAESTDETRWDSADLSTVDEAAAAEARAAAAEASELAADKTSLATLSTAEEPSTAELSEVSTRRDPAVAAAATPAILTVATPEMLTVEPVGGLLASTASHCVHKPDAWWTYEVCLGESVRQIHEHSKDGKAESYLLGNYDEASSQKPAHKPGSSNGVQIFNNGDACGGGGASHSQRRRAEVVLRCNTMYASLELVSFSEYTPCNYRFEVEAPASSSWCEGVTSDGAATASATASATSSMMSWLWGSSAGGGGNGAAAAGAQAAGGAVQGASSESLRRLDAIAVSGDQQVSEKRAAVVDAIRHSWSGYRRYAWGADELKPVTKEGSNLFGLGLTILDSLDVLYMAGLKAEFDEAVGWVRTSLRFDSPLRYVSVFETTIRCLGGLLSAHELSGEKVLLDKARDLGDRLLKAFATPSGLPYTTTNLGTGRHAIPEWTRGLLVLAEVGTVQMEFWSLAQHMGQPRYVEPALKVYEILDREGAKLMRNGGRLWPIYVGSRSGKPTGSTVSWGAMGDSFYEYLLKLWLLTGKTEPRYRRMYLESIKGLQGRLLSVSGGLTYVAEMKEQAIKAKMDHLVCFLPGTLALGAQHIPEVAAEHLDIAKKLMITCHQMYSRTPTGLAPEYVTFTSGTFSSAGMHVDPDPGALNNLLRPETVESLFYLWRFTKDPIYREWGWTIFVAFERYCKVASGGYSGIKSVMTKRPQMDDTMQSFWVAETLKYLLLLFSEDDALDLNTHVFNTEAHPLRISA